MITIPTCELIGLLTDVIGFAPDDRGSDPHAGIVLQWRDDQLNAWASDVLSGGWSTWKPGHGEEALAHMGEASTKATDELDPYWGEDEENGGNWDVFIPLAAAKEIIKVYKLAFKFRLTPLTVEPSIGQDRLIVARAKQEWCSGNTTTIDTPDRQAVVDIVHPEGVALTAQNDYERDAYVLTDPIVLVSHRLARFATVREESLTWYYRGPKEPMGVIGGQFHGFVFPAGQGAARAAEILAKS